MEGGLVTTDKRRLRRRTDVQTHTSGALVYWAERAEGNRQKVLIKCVTCGKKKFVKTETARDKTWSGRCFDCFIKAGGANPRKVIADEPVAFGSIIHWSEWGSGLRLPVTCGICVATGAATTKRTVSRGGIPPKSVRESPDYQLFCRGHSRAEVTRHLARFQSAENAAAEQLSTPSSGGTGRPGKFTDASDFKSQALKSIAALGVRASVKQLAAALGCSRGTVQNYAKELGYGSAREFVDAYRPQKGGAKKVSGMPKTRR